MSNVIKIFENDEFGSLRTLTDEHGRIKIGRAHV